MIKYLDKIFLLLCVLSCEHKTNSNEVSTSEAESKDIMNKRIITNEEMKEDEFLPLRFIFGRYCNKTCVPIFNLNMDGNSLTFHVIYENHYPSEIYSLDFETDIATKSNLKIALEVVSKTPSILREWEEDDVKFGDSENECNIIIYFNEFGHKRKTFQITLTDSSDIPKEILTYAQFVNRKINDLLPDGCPPRYSEFPLRSNSE